VDTKKKILLQTYQENNLHKEKHTRQTLSLTTHHSFSLNNDPHHQSKIQTYAIQRFDIHGQAVLTVV